MIHRAILFSLLIISLLTTRPVHILAQDQHGITLEGYCYYRDTISHSNKHLGGVCLVLFCDADQSRQCVETGSLGHFKFSIQPGKVYHIIAKKRGYYNSTRETISTFGITDTATLYRYLILHVPVLVDYFGGWYLGHDDVEPDASHILLMDSLSKILKVYSYLIVEIGAHTDACGTTRRCDSISLLRALAVKNYLVARGIDSNRLFTHGYGKTQPLSNCGCAPYKDTNQRECSDAENMSSNRIAIKILSSPPARKSEEGCTCEKR